MPPIRSGHAANPSKHVLDRSAKMKARVLAAFDDHDREVQVEIVPDEENKATRMVGFVRRGEDIEITCWDKESLVACPANRFSRLCSHAFAAINHVLRELESKD